MKHLIATFLLCSGFFACSEKPGARLTGVVTFYESERRGYDADAGAKVIIFQAKDSLTHLADFIAAKDLLYAIEEDQHLLTVDSLMCVRFKQMIVAGTPAKSRLSRDISVRNKTIEKLRAAMAQRRQALAAMGLSDQGQFQALSQRVAGLVDQLKEHKQSRILAVNEEGRYCSELLPGAYHVLFISGNINGDNPAEQYGALSLQRVVVNSDAITKADAVF